jgi:sugar O-acyltransferase (sialic acid O-acetyltransferase NeuD family)
MPGSTSKMTPLIIVGTGGSAWDVVDIVEAVNSIRPTWNILGLLDDFRSAGSRFVRWPVLGAIRDAQRFEDAAFVNVIGSDKSYLRRAELTAGMGLAHERFATLVHPVSGVSPRAILGHGVYVNYGVSVAGNVTLGHHVALSPGCIIGHDTTIGDYTLVAPGAVISGFVTVGRETYVGAGAVLKQGVRVGDKALVGIGAVVTRDVPPGDIVIGNPARSRAKRDG